MGASFRRTPINIREKLTKTITFEALEKFKKNNGELFKNGLEIVLVSTCNRTELYFSSPNLLLAQELCLKILHEGMKYDSSFELAGAPLYAYEYLDERAVGHLFYVASGLDSLITGEAQILYQVREAMGLAKDQKLCGLVLSKLFLKAYSTGREIRETHPLLTNGFRNSVSLSVANLISDYFRDRPKPNVLIVGSGKMAKLADSSFDRRSVGRLVVASRKASSQGMRADRAIQISEISQVLVEEEIDVLIVATASADYVITPKTLELYSTSAGIMKDLLIVDISIPRNVDPVVKSMFPNTKLINLDDLKERAAKIELEAEKSPELALELRSVQRMIESRSAEFLNWLGGRSDIAPIMDLLRKKAEDIRAEEYRNAISRLGDLKPEEREVVRKMSERIVRRFLHDPATRLNSTVRSGEMAKSKEYAELLKLLFSLEADESAHSVEKEELEQQVASERSRPSLSLS